MPHLRDLSKCNKCGEPLRAGICSDELDCLLDRVTATRVPAPAGRSHIGRMAQPVNLKGVR